MKQRMQWFMLCRGCQCSSVGWKALEVRVRLGAVQRVPQLWCTLLVCGSQGGSYLHATSVLVGTQAELKAHVSSMLQQGPPESGSAPSCQLSVTHLFSCMYWNVFLVCANLAWQLLHAIAVLWPYVWQKKWPYVWHDLVTATFLVLYLSVCSSSLLYVHDMHAWAPAPPPGHGASNPPVSTSRT
jgi:hypothetical protein